MRAPQVDLPASGRADFGKRPLLASHDLHENELFSDAALVELLDSYPREHLYALTMGSDPARTDGNQLALHDGVSGADLLRAVRNGRLWLNVTRVDLVDARYRRLIDQLYVQLVAQATRFAPLEQHGTLLISSPGVLVYYHADAPVSVLWHIRGRKRVRVYPALDERYVRHELLEDIFAGVRHEYLPYEPAYDQAAVVYDLVPGQWVTWPQNAPHQVDNLDSVNVSLVTEHVTRESRRRAQLYRANRFLRLRLGLRNLSRRESGPMAIAKTAVHRIARRAGLDPVQLKQHVAALRVDPNAPAGVVALHPGRGAAGAVR